MRHLLLAAGLGLCLGLLSLSCGSTGGKVPCTVANCGGCCDATGACVQGELNTACGNGGLTCSVCAAPLACVNRACGTLDGGGAGGSGGWTGDAGDGCIDAARLVYVVEIDNTFSSFNPSLLDGGTPFTNLGRLSCPAQYGAAPFSMSVDRNAIGWVIYDSGELFRVDIKNSLTCTATSFAPQTVGGINVGRFGMGFAANAAGSQDETLFISGSSLTSQLSQTLFGTLATTPPYTLSARGQLTGSPELTGTGDGALWAFFPDTAPPAVSELNKSTGATLRTFSAPSLAGTPAAWAFAFWGGDFWIFLERTQDFSTVVYRVNGQTGAVRTVIADSGRTIVGAGVSTCAPVTIN